MWLTAVWAGVLIVIAFWGCLFLVARLLPAGRTREYVAFAPNCVILLRRLQRDHQLPLRSRWALAAALAYLVSPIQLIPNVVPVLGQTDDILVLAAALRYTARHIPRSEVEVAWPGDPRHLDRLLGSPDPSVVDEATAGVDV